MTTLEGSATDKGYSATRALLGGGPGSHAFDFNVSTYWDAPLLPEQDKEITYSFDGCVAGAAVASYSLVSNELCPSEWKLEGSKDGEAWFPVDERTGQDCGANGKQTYTVQSNMVGYYRKYRFTFSGRTAAGTPGNRIREVYFGFKDEGVTGLELARLCDQRGNCCRFQGGVCDPSSNHTYKALKDVSHDFEYGTGVLSWPDGDSSTRVIRIPLQDDCMGCTGPACSKISQFQDKVHEKFNVKLIDANDVQINQATGTPASTYPFRKPPILSPSSSAEVTIRDDDGPGALALQALSCGVKSGSIVEPFVTFTGLTEPGNDASCPVLESAGVIGFQVTRSGKGRGAISVQYSVNVGTAIPGRDYEIVNGTLQWPHGDNSGKNFTVLIKEDPGYQTGRYIRSVTARLITSVRADGYLQVPGGAEIALCERSIDGVCVETGKDEFTVQILDVHANPGTIVIDRSELERDIQYNVDEVTGLINITVKRVGGTDLPLKVSYSTKASGDLLGATACTADSTAPCDYEPVSGTLYWADGDGSDRNVTIKIRMDTLQEPFETFLFVVEGWVRDAIDYCEGYAPYYSSDGAVMLGRKLVDLHCNTPIYSEATVTVRDSLQSGYFELRAYDWPFVVSDNTPTINLAIDRVNGEGGIVAVQAETFTPTGTTGVDGKHFSAIQQQKQWYNLDSQPKIVAIQIVPSSVPTDSVVDLFVRLTWVSSNTAINQQKKLARILIRSSNFRPLLLRKDLTESSLVVNEDNTLTFSFRINTVLAVGGVMTIQGLLGMRTPDSDNLPIAGTAAKMFGNKAVWRQSTGRIEFTVAQGRTIEFNTDYTVSFVLQNPSAPQQGVVPTVAVYGECRLVHDFVVEFVE
jgi:hypothetical protein